ncbi:heme b synthase [Nitrospira sp.]|nr:heme b synthase [Nitrospira sp.]
MKRIEAESFRSQLALKTASVRHPEGVTFELTYGCNLRCLHCFNPTHRALPNELPTAEVHRIVEQLAAFNVLTVTFTGGEPTIRPDIGPILRHARKQGLLLRLLTNATRMTASLIETLQQVATEQIYVSIYGATQYTYDRMTGAPGGYAAFRRGLDLLAGSALPVVVRMPVTTINQHEVLACKSLIEHYRFKFQYCFDVTPTVSGNLIPLSYRLSPEDKIRLDGELLGAREISGWDTPCTASPDFIDCACGKTRFAITPYGEMNLCTVFPIPRYDLRTGTIAEGWEVLKRTVDEARSNEHDQCPACEVRPHCRQGRVDAWLETGDMSPCLPHFKRWAEAESRAHALLDPRQAR